MIISRSEEATMTDSRLAELLKSKDGRAVSRETIESWRLLKMFIQLSPAERLEIIELVERYLRRRP
jgi:hypothetical protein